MAFEVDYGIKMARVGDYFKTILDTNVQTKMIKRAILFYINTDSIWRNRTTPKSKTVPTIATTGKTPTHLRRTSYLRRLKSFWKYFELVRQIAIYQGGPKSAVTSRNVRLLRSFLRIFLDLYGRFTEKIVMIGEI